MRQTIRVIKTPLMLLALIALVTFGGMWGWRNATAQIPVPPAAACVMTNVGTALTPHYVTVRTLNAGLRGGLAKRVSTTLRSHGFFIVKVNNSEERLAQTVIIGNSPDSPEVKLVAGFFNNANVQGDGRADHIVDVLLGDDFAGYHTNPVKSVAVKGPVCLPKLPASVVSTLPSPTPTPTPTKKK